MWGRRRRPVWVAGRSDLCLHAPGPGHPPTHASTVHLAHTSHASLPRTPTHPHAHVQTRTCTLPHAGELSHHADELWVLRSLGNEVLLPGGGGGTAWDHEHLGGGAGDGGGGGAGGYTYRACWQNPLSDGGFDSALCDGTVRRARPLAAPELATISSSGCIRRPNSLEERPTTSHPTERPRPRGRTRCMDHACRCNDGLSRWANYYVEGLRWLLRPPASIDGIYYDGIAFGANTMRRVRRVMQEEKAGGGGEGGGLIDLHCGNNLAGTPANPNAYGRVQPALQVLPPLPPGLSRCFSPFPVSRCRWVLIPHAPSTLAAAACSSCSTSRTSTRSGLARGTTTTRRPSTGCSRCRGSPSG